MSRAATAIARFLPDKLTMAAAAAAGLAMLYIAPAAAKARDDVPGYDLGFIGIGIGLHLRSSGGAFSPAQLYRPGDILLWYDPSDLTTMFTDTTGTTQVAADGDSVALMLDKGQWGGKTLAQVLAAQPELVTNGTFDSDLTGWTVGSDAAQVIPTWDAGRVSLTRGAGGAAGFTQSGIAASGKSYRVRFTLVSGGVNLYLGSVQIASVSGAGEKEFVIVSTGTAALQFWPGVSSTCVLDNISVKEIPGYHRVQATGTSMPKYKTGPNPAAAENSPELVTNGTFDTDLTGWTINDATRGTAVASGGRAVLTNNHALGSTAGFTGIIDAVSTEIGTWYRYEANLAGTAGMSASNNSNGAASFAQVTGTGDKQLTFQATATTTYLVHYVNSATDAATANFDDTSLKEIPASAPYIHWLLYDGTDDGHATGTIPFNTVTSDGLARRNLIPNPTALSDISVWANTSVTMTADAVTAPDGTSTGDTLARTSTAFGENNLRRTTTQSTSTEYTFSAYVKANTAGAKLYLRNLAVDNGTTNGVVHFDPSDGSVSLTYGSTYAGKATMVSVGDGWYRCAITGTTPGSITNNLLDIGVTNGATAVGGTTGDSVHVWGAQLELGSTATDFQNIGTDEVAICAGVTKSSDAAAGMIAELSASASSNNGSFALFGTTLDRYSSISNGTTAATNTTAQVFPEPTTNVLTMQADVSADSIALRVDATEAASSSSDQGTGNFGSYAMYFGRRGGSTLPFNGREYQTVIRNRLLSAAELSSLETFVAAKTGVILP